MHMAHINEEAGSISFFTGKGGNLVEEIQKEAVTLLEFHNETPPTFRCPGALSLPQGAANIKELWKEPQGMVS
jgi:hypothetical protein